MSLSQRSEESIHEILRAIPIFSDLSKRQLNALSRTARTQSFEPGQVICEEGHTGVGLHVIEDGEVEVEIGGTSKRQMGAGAFFGEVALLDGGPRSATVIAKTPTKTLSLTSWDFKSLLEQHPEIAAKMLPELARRLRDQGSTQTHD